MSNRILPFLFFLSFVAPNLSAADSNTRLTIIYDAFGPPTTLTKDWGFSLLVEHEGSQFLFDTGNNDDIFAHNVSTSGVDLSKLQFAVISHRHGDHMGGLAYLVSQRPDLTVYAPREGFGVFGADLPGDFYPPNPALSDKMRYFDGKPPERLSFGTAWPQAKFNLVTETKKVAAGVHLIALKGSWGTDLPLQELSLVIETPKGLVIVVGCSHPTIEKIIDTAKTLFKKPVHLVIGGTHLLPAPADEIQRIATTLRDVYEVEWVAPAHCTGEPAFGVLTESFRDHYLYAGLGSVISLDTETGNVSSAPLANLPILNNPFINYNFNLTHKHEH
jgi:7,8-dihydropterin-6-yl-methyl-4-(beta-D-ribofuranosyl)aminobenzene 5'-phosphate synthase